MVILFPQQSGAGASDLRILVRGAQRLPLEIAVY